MQFYGLSYVPLLRKTPGFHDGLSLQVNGPRNCKILQMCKMFRTTEILHHFPSIIVAIRSFVYSYTIPLLVPYFLKKFIFNFQKQEAFSNIN